MSATRLSGKRLIRSVGAISAGLAGAQSAEAAIVYQAVDEPVPPTYGVDFNGDTTVEFNIAESGTVTKVADLAATTALVQDAGDSRTANLASGALIGPGSTFSADGAVPSGGDALNGVDAGNPVGHFQPTDPSGFIGVKFGLGGNTHFGYVGYEGVGDPADPTGHVFALAYESTPDTAIAAGAIPEPSSLALLAAGAAGVSLFRRRISQGTRNV